MKIILVLSVLVLFSMIVIPAYALTYTNQNFGFEIYYPRGWTSELSDYSSTENIVKFQNSQGNGFLYVALMKSPPISSSFVGNAYLEKMEEYFKKNCNCVEFTTTNKYSTNSNGKTAYVLLYNMKINPSSPVTLTKHIEIPDGSKTWRISNQYNTNNYLGDVDHNRLISSFKTTSTFTNPQPSPSIPSSPNQNNPDSNSNPSTNSNSNGMNTELIGVLAVIAIIVIVGAVVSSKRKRGSGSYGGQGYYPPNQGSGGFDININVNDRREYRRDYGGGSRYNIADEGRRISDAFTDAADDSARFANDFFGDSSKKKRR